MLCLKYLILFRIKNVYIEFISTTVSSGSMAGISEKSKTSGTSNQASK